MGNRRRTLHPGVPYHPLDGGGADLHPVPQGALMDLHGHAYHLHAPLTLFAAGAEAFTLCPCLTITDLSIGECRLEAHLSKGRGVGRFCRWGYEDASNVVGPRGLVG